MGKSTQFVGHLDGVGGLVIPDEAVTQLSGKTVHVDGIAYPFVVYKGRKYPVVQTSQGWTIGGKVAERQHAKNITLARRIIKKTGLPKDVVIEMPGTPGMKATKKRTT